MSFSVTLLAWVPGRRKSWLRARDGNEGNDEWEKPLLIKMEDRKFSRFHWWCHSHRCPGVQKSSFPFHLIPVSLLSLGWEQTNLSIPVTSSLGWWLDDNQNPLESCGLWCEMPSRDPPYLWPTLTGKVSPILKWTILGSPQKIRGVDTVSLSMYWAPILCRCEALGLWNEQGRHDGHPQRAYGLAVTPHSVTTLTKERHWHSPEGPLGRYITWILFSLTNSFGKVKLQSQWDGLCSCKHDMPKK